MNKYVFIFIITCNLAFGQNQIITTVAGKNQAGHSGDGGPALSAQIGFPSSVSIDSSGNIYLVENDTYIRKVTKSGIISTVAGNGTHPYTGDGGLAISAGIWPAAIAADNIGNLYIADNGNARIRKVNSSGFISTIAGNGGIGYTGDGGQAINAEIGGPVAITLDDTGNVYLSDGRNHVIRKINLSGVISTFAGTGVMGFSGDGAAAVLATFSNPSGINFDNKGNLFVADLGNHRIRMVDTMGIITTIAGSTPGFGGDGGLATSANLTLPTAVAIDTLGNVFIADNSNQRIRKVDTAGIISTYAGTGYPTGYSGDGGPAILAQFSNPYWVAAKPSGGIFVADAGNHVIRQIGECIPIIPEICMVAVDSLSLNNVIYWDKTLYPTADTFYIYRDTSNNGFAPIAKVAASALSAFTDTVRTLYAANGDPNITNWTYKISYTDTCGAGKVMSPMSPWHRTIFQYNIGGLFVWNHYQIEGQMTPVPGLVNYLLRRDNLGATGIYVTAATAAAASTSINDPQYTTFQATADWKVETLWTTQCNPTMKIANNTSQMSISKTRSNIKNNRVNGIKQFGLGVIKIYPNPTTDILVVQLNKPVQNAQIEILNTLGQVVRSEILLGENPQLNLVDLSNGVYSVRIFITNVLAHQSILVKQ